MRRAPSWLVGYNAPPTVAVIGLLFVPERWDPPRVEHHVREKRDMSDTQKHDTLTDAELWGEVLRDSPEAFEQVVTRYQNLIASIAYSWSGDLELSEEITQETFWQSWRQRHQLNDPTRLRGWLREIARRLTQQAWGRKNRTAAGPLEFEPGSNHGDPAQLTISLEERQLVWDALSGVPEKYREAMVLYYREEHSIAEVAEALDVSSDVAKQRIHRGRAMLREHLLHRVEDLLTRTRPGRTLTTRIMIGLGALTASLKATVTANASTWGATSATEASKLAGATAGTSALATLQSAAAAGAATGILGGLLGAFGGLGGAFLGCWLPAQMADTLEERRILEQYGRRAFLISVIYTLVILLLTPLLFLSGGTPWYFTGLGVSTLVFTATIVVKTLQLLARLKAMKHTLSGDRSPNTSPIKEFANRHYSQLIGRRYTSEWRLGGVPWIDIQVSDAGESRVAASPRHARGWIAIGDHATGYLLAIGGTARGLVAVGGLACGVIAVGGGAVGIVTIGGGAVGGLAIGGFALGYQAAGGVAIGWTLATGGAALAYHLAVGGAALAHDYAVGGGAWAAEANTDTAKAAAAQAPLAQGFLWVSKNQIYVMIVILIISFSPLFLTRLFYIRGDQKHPGQTPTDLPS